MSTTDHEHRIKELEAQLAQAEKDAGELMREVARLREHSKSVLSDLLRRARPYVEAGSVPEESLLEEIDAALSEKVTVFQTSECHKPNSSGEA